MGFIETIQANLVDHNIPAASSLLKLRLLAARLGSNELTDWIKQEANGYQNSDEIPDYRIVPIYFSGTFHGPFGSGVKNAPIPSALIQQIVGEEWVTHKLADSAASIEQMARAENGLKLDLSNLMLLIRGKVYPGYEPAQLVGLISQASLIETSNAIRTRLLEITIEIAKNIPSAESADLSTIDSEPEMAKQIFHQTIHGNMMNVQSTGSESVIRVSITQGDSTSLRAGLEKLGLTQKVSNELVSLISAEQPRESEEDGLNAGVRRWLAKRITKGADHGIKGGIAAVTQIIQEAAMQYWGLK